MLLAATVEVDGPGEVRAGLERVHLLFQKQRVGADDDEFLARDTGLDDFGDFAVQQGFSPGDDHHGRAAFVHRLKALGNRQALIEDLGRVVDLAATGAGQIAAE